MEIIRKTIKVGNSAGVLLPKAWLNSQVKITLEPLNIEKDVLEILIKEKLLKQVIGVYIAGSYARGEQTIESDIDVLVITKDISKKIVKEKYEILCISLDALKNQFKKNALPILPMLIEAKTIINEQLRDGCAQVKLNKENLKFHIETTKTAMNVVKANIKIIKELKECNTSDNIAYSLILRLRTLYILDCIRKNRLWSNKEFLWLIKKISGSTQAYEGYLRSKNNKKDKTSLPVEEAEELMNYINKKVKEVEEWAVRKK